MIAYTSVYGNTKKAAELLAQKLEEKGCPKVVVCDQNRTIGLIENGSWAPTAAKVMKGMFEKSKNITWLENNVKIMSSLSDENVAEIDAMAEELCK